MNSNIALILLLLSVGLFYTFTNGQYKAAMQARTLSSEYKSILHNVSAIEELRDGLEVVYESIPSGEIDRLNKVLPDNNDTVKLALELDNMAALHGISLRSIGAETEGNSNAGGIVMPGSGPYDKVRISLSFVASYDDFINFLTDLERNLRLMDVRTLSFQSGDAGLYNYSLAFDTYWLR